jgi:hypothetical protein
VLLTVLWFFCNPSWSADHLTEVHGPRFKNLCSVATTCHAARIQICRLRQECLSVGKNKCRWDLYVLFKILFDVSLTCNKIRNVVYMSCTLIHFLSVCLFVYNTVGDHIRSISTADELSQPSMYSTCMIRAWPSLRVGELGGRPMCRAELGAKLT